MVGKNLSDMTAQEISEWMAELKREAREGGTLTDLPCPFCGKPRSQRSDYIRCQPCGVNWLDEEMHLEYQGRPYLSLDPRLVRQTPARMASATQPTADTGSAERSADAR